MRHNPFNRHHRPPWWPENEDWPPPRRLRHYPFFRRLGCAFAFANMLAWGLLVFVLLSVARLLGWVTFGGASVPWLIPGIAALVVASAVTMGVVGWGMRRVFSPLDDLVQAAERVTEGDYSVRVQERGPRAVGSLARAFNNMASHLNRTQSNRRDLLADVTHEMRTPLTVIQGNLEGMLDGVYAADATHLRALLDETTLLSRVIDDLRTLALAESGELQLKTEMTALDALIRDAAAAFQAQAAAQGVRIAVDVAANTPSLNVDPVRIRQVLANLLANALRYTPAGGSIRLGCELVDGRIVIAVQDSGAGIAPEDLPHVFERFYRASDSGGMGLGLAIAKHLAESHGGTLTATSERGHGTTMQIALPIAA